MTTNQAIHCSCGLVFDNRGQATQHIEYVRDILRAGDAHTVIDETSAEAPTETSTRESGRSRTVERPCPPGFLCVHEPRCPGAANPMLPSASQADLRHLRLDALAREAVDAKLEMMRGKLAINTTIVAGEVARSRYEAARVKLEQIDKAMDVELAGMIAELGEAKAP